MSGEVQTVAPVEAADTSALEREIDRIVYDLYGLTEEEIAIVEGRRRIFNGTRYNASDEDIKRGSSDPVLAYLSQMSFLPVTRKTSF
jgi:hypothetical protein